MEPLPQPAPPTVKTPSRTNGILLAALSALLLGLALPSRGVAPLVFVALVPLLHACRRSSGARGLFLGFGAGMLAGGIGLGVPSGAREAAHVLAVTLPLAVVTGLAGFGAAVTRRLPAPWWALGVACLGVLAERISFALLPIHLGLCLWRWTDLIQIAALTGIWGVSFLLWWANAAIAASTLRDARPLFGPAVLMVLAVLVGSRLMAVPGGDRPYVVVAAIQTGGRSDGEMAALVDRATAQEARVVVFPEIAAGEWRPADGRPLRALSRVRGYAVIGYIERDDGRRYNCAGVFSPRGRLIGSYRKVHLFGSEHLKFARGKTTGVVPLPMGPVGTPICFDTCLPDVCRQMALGGAVFLLSGSNDPPSPRRVLNPLHAAFGPFRSVESGVALVHADTNAGSLITDRFGRIAAGAATAGPGLAVARLECATRRTPYRRWGDWFANLCAVAAAGFLLAGRWIRD